MIVHGTNQNTTFNVIDFNGKLDLIIGGNTNDTEYTSVQNVPFIVFVMAPDTWIWYKQYDSNYNYVANMKFMQQTGVRFSNIAVVLRRWDNTKQFTLLILNSLNGSIISTFKDQQTTNFVTGDSRAIITDSSNIYLAYTFQDKKAALVRFKFDSATSTISMVYQYKSNTANWYIKQIVTEENAPTNIYAGGYIDNGSTKKVVISYFNMLTGSNYMHYGSSSGSSTYHINRLKYYSTNAGVFACVHGNGFEVIRFTVANAITTGTPDAYSSFKDSSRTNVFCSDIYVSSWTSVVVSLQDKSDYGIYLASLDLSTKLATYTKALTFSYQQTTLQFSYFVSASNLYYGGQGKYIYDNQTTIVYNNYFGFVMGNLQNQSCVNQKFSINASVSLTTGISNFAKFSDTFQGVSDTFGVASLTAATNMSSSTTTSITKWCSTTSSVSLYIGNNFYYKLTTGLTNYSLTYNADTCDGALMRMYQPSSLPSYITYDGNRTVSVNTSSLADAGTQFVSFYTFLFNNQKSYWVYFWVYISNPCSTAPIAYNTISDITYIVSSGSKTFPLTPFTKNLTTCDITYSFSYVINGSALNTDLFPAYGQDPNLTISTTNNFYEGTYIVKINGMNTMGSPNYPNNNTVFLVKILNSCYGSVVQSTPIPTSYYDINSGVSADVAVIAWSYLNSTECSATTSYSVKTSTGGIPNVAIFTQAISGDTITIRVSTSDPAYIGKYDMIVNYTAAPYVWTSQTFTVYIASSDCETTTISTPTITDVDYYVGNSALSITFSSWTEALGYCGTFLYYAQSDSLDLPTFISQSNINSTRTLSVYTTSMADIGTYNISINGSISQYFLNRTVYFLLNIKDPCTGATWYKPSTFINTYYAKTSDSSLTLSAFTSSGSSSVCGVTTYNITENNGPIDNVLFTFSTSTRIMGIKTSTATSIDVGTYEFILCAFQGTYTDYGTCLTFYITITERCFTTTVTTGSNKFFSYNIRDPQTAFSVPSFTQPYSECTTQYAFTYWLEYSNGTAIDTSIFSITQSPLQVLVYTTDKYQAGTQSIKMFGVFGNSTLNITSSSIILQISFVVTCYDTVVYPYQVANQTYNINNKAKTVQITEWTEQLGICTPFTYQASINGNVGNSNDIISFDPSTRIFTFYSQNLNSAGIYTIQIVGTATIGYQNDTMSFTLTAYISNQGGPYFISALQKIVLYVPQTTKYTLPDVLDDDQDDYVIGIFYGSTSGFVKYTSPYLEVYSFNNYAGNHTLQIVLTDTNTSPLSNTYLLQIQIIANETTAYNRFNQSQTTNQTEQVLPDEDEYSEYEIIEYDQYDPVKNTTTHIRKRVKKYNKVINGSITDISMYGVVTIQFNDTMLQYSDYSFLSITNALMISVVKKDEWVIQDVYYNVTQIKNDEMKVQLKFDDPRNISNGLGYDNLQIAFVKNVLFLNQNRSAIVSKLYTVEHEIPPQIQDSSNNHILSCLGIVNALAVVSQTVSYTLAATLGISLILQLIMGLSMKKLWMLIQTLQIIVHLPMFTITFPSFAMMVFQFLIEISNLNVIPKKYIKQYIFKFITSSTAESKENFKYADNELLNNLGMIFAVMILLIICGLLIVLTRRLVQRYKMYYTLLVVTIFSAKMVYDKISQKLFYNSYIRSILKGYLNFSISMMISVQIVFTSPSLINAITTIIFAFALTAMPVAVYYFTIANYQKLQDKTFHAKVATLYRNVKLNSLVALISIPLFFTRRLIFAASLVFLGSQPIIQIFLQIVSSLCMFIFYFAVKPYCSMNLIVFELYNELTLLSISYLLIPLTMYEKEFTNDTKETVGYVIVTLTLANIAINWINIIVGVIIKVVKFIKKKIQERKNKKKAKVEQGPEPIKYEIPLRKESTEIDLMNSQNGLRFDYSTINSPNRLQQLNSSYYNIFERQPSFIHLKQIADYKQNTLPSIQQNNKEGQFNEQSVNSASQDEISNNDETQIQNATLDNLNGISLDEDIQELQFKSDQLTKAKLRN